MSSYFDQNDTPILQVTFGRCRDLNCLLWGILLENRTLFAQTVLSQYAWWQKRGPDTPPSSLSAKYERHVPFQKKFKQKLMVFEIIAWKFDITLMNSSDNYINLRLFIFFSSFFEIRDKLIWPLLEYWINVMLYINVEIVPWYINYCNYHAFDAFAMLCC